MSSSSPLSASTPADSSATQAATTRSATTQPATAQSTEPQPATAWPQSQSQSDLQPNSPSPSPSLSASASSSQPRHHLGGDTLRRGVLPILLVSVLWGGVGLVSTLAPAAASTASISAAATILGGALLFFTAPAARTLLLHSRGRDRLLIAAGAVTVLGYQQSFFPAVRLLGVAQATVLALGSAPLFAGAIARWIQRRPLPARWTACAPIAVGGCALLILGGTPHAADASAHTPGRHALGVVLALLPGLAYAITSTIAAHFIETGRTPRAAMGALFGGAGLIALPILAATGAGWVVSGRGVGVTLYLGAVTTFLCYTLFGRALRHTPAAVATTLTLTEGAVGALLGLAVRGERLSAAAWAGLGLLALALVVLSLPAKARRARSESEAD